MNDTSGFQETRPFPSQSSTNRLLHEQRYGSGKDTWQLLPTHNRIPLSVGGSTKRQWFLAPLFCLITMSLLLLARPVLGIAEDHHNVLSSSELSDQLEVTLPFDPLPIGCYLEDCDCHDCRSSDTIDWHIVLTGPIAESFTLRFDNLPRESAKSITLSGRIERVGDSPFVYRVMKGESVIRGLPFPTVPKAWSSSMQRLESFMNIIDSVGWPAAVLKEFVVDKSQLEKMKSERHRHIDREPQRAQDSIRMFIEQWIGNRRVAKSFYNNFLRPKLERVPTTPSDRVDMPPTLVTTNPENAVFLIDGLRDPPMGWSNDEIFRDGGTGRALVGNYLKDDGLCREKNLNNEICHSEVAVFEKNHAFRLASPVSDWTNLAGDVHTTGAETRSLSVPLHMWILWENNPNPANTTKDTTAKLAQTWVNTANTLFDTSSCGVQFKIVAIEDKTGAGRNPIPSSNNRPWAMMQCSDASNHFEQFKQDVGYQPDAVNVYFTDMPSGDTIPGWTCDSFDPNVILIRTPLPPPVETLAHELGHALSLEHTNETSVNSYDYDSDGDPDFGEDNLMWGGGLTRSKISMGQCFRCNVNEASALHRNSIPGAALSGPAQARRCFDPVRSFSCPWLGLSE